MSRTVWGGLFLLIIGVALWKVQYAGRDPSPPRTRGPEGIDFVVPSEYRVMDLGEIPPAEAASRLLETLDRRERVAAVFTNRGDRVQWLADPGADLLDERVMGGNGTVRRILWADSLKARLGWAKAEGNLAAPGLPPPDRRNPYH